MRFVDLAGAVLLGMAAVSALAQALPLDLSKVMLTGDPPGRGDSPPRSDKASNISPADRLNVASNLPAGLSGMPRDYSRSARALLIAGRTGEARQSLEMAETRALGGSVSPDKVSAPSDDPLVARIRDAFHTLEDGDKGRAIPLIGTALSN